MAADPRDLRKVKIAATSPKASPNADRLWPRDQLQHLPRDPIRRLHPGPEELAGALGVGGLLDHDLEVEAIRRQVGPEQRQVFEVELATNQETALPRLDHLEAWQHLGDGGVAHIFVNLDAAERLHLEDPVQEEE